MFISVGNFINLRCHVKGNFRPVVIRLAGELGYLDVTRRIRKSEGEDAPRLSNFYKVEVKPYCFLIPCQIEITFGDYSLTSSGDKYIIRIPRQAL